MSFPDAGSAGRGGPVSGSVPVVSLDDASRISSPRVVPTVVVVGLGPAGPELTTLEARDVVADMGVVLLRTGRHPSAAPLLEDGARALDEHYERAATFDEAYASIVEEVVAAAVEHGRVAYCVPGSPFVLERSVAALVADERIAVKVVPGMSFLELAWTRLLLDPVSARVRLIDAEDFAVAAAGDVGPMLVTQLWSKAICSDVKLAVERSPARPVVLLHHLGLDDEVVREVAWDELDRVVEPDHLTCIFVRELTEPVGRDLLALSELVRTLRERCPWDREQSHESLVRNLVEETYEVVEAIEELGDSPSPAAAEHLEEELGDLLCQVFFHATLAAEEGLFNLADVARAVHDKLVRRHPHVFDAAARASVATAAEVVERWEQAKRVEKGRSSLMDGIPSSLPGLALGAKLESRAASAGLGWTTVGTSTAELHAILDDVAVGRSERLGELLLAVARIAASTGVDPEEALRRDARSLREMIVATESAAKTGGRDLAQLDREELIALWQESMPR